MVYHLMSSALVEIINKASGCLITAVCSICPSHCPVRRTLYPLSLIHPRHIDEHESVHLTGNDADSLKDSPTRSVTFPSETSLNE